MDGQGMNDILEIQTIERTITFYVLIFPAADYLHNTRNHKCVNSQTLGRLTKIDHDVNSQALHHIIIDTKTLNFHIMKSKKAPVGKKFDL